MLKRRIRGEVVGAAFPDEGEVRAVLVGEAPGPRGADRSGVPFWGDRAGRVVYRVLADAGMAEVAGDAWGLWDGEKLKQRALWPSLRGVALTNAFGRCPTGDGEKFRAPSDRELNDEANVRRLRDEIARAQARCPTELRVIALGRRAKWLLDRMGLAADVLPHPSAQGLLQAAPDHGRGCRLADLEAAWATKLKQLLVGARARRRGTRAGS